MSAMRQQLLEKLNSVKPVTEKSIIKFEDLIVGKNYIIIEIKAVNTRFGPKILVETEENIIFLPDRFNVFCEGEVENLNQLCSEQLTMVKPDKYNIRFI